MKLRNKKTGEITTDFAYILLEATDYRTYNSISELCKDWEDVTPLEFSKYYLINEETGYIITFDSEREMKIFQNEIDGWKPVKVLLDGEKYTIDRM